MTRFSSVLIGDAPLLLHCAEVLLARGHDVGAIVTADPAIADWATAHAVTVIAPGKGLAGRLRGQRIDWLFNITGLRMIDAETLALPTRGAVNFHDGPLPFERGLNVPVWALLEGAPRHAVTWHRIVPQVDAGDILIEAPVGIETDETALSLNTKCMVAGIESFGLLVDAIEGNALAPRPQPEDAPGTLRRGTDRPALAGCLDFGQTAEALARLVRALDHGPHWNPLTLPKVLIGGQAICVRRAEPAPDAGQGAHGRVLAVTPETLTIACAGGAVELSRLTCLAGQPVDATRVAAYGDAVAPPDPALTERLARAAPHEGHWRRALHKVRPLALPGLTDAVAGPEAAPQELPLRLPAGLSLAGLGALLGAVLVRSGVAAPVSIAAALDDAAHPDALFAPWGPVAIDAGKSLRATEDAIARDLARPGWPYDLIARDPVLGADALPAAAVTRAAPLPGAALTLIADGPRLVFDPARLSRSVAHTIAARLSHLAAHAAPDDALADQDAIPPAERARALAGQEDTTRSYDRVCIHDAFAAQAARTPDAAAVVFEDVTLSYAELDARANRAAHVLRAMGVGRDQPVGLCTRRGPQMLVGALAILKAGGAYVPMDPSYPADRLAHYLADSGAQVIVTEHTVLDALPARTGALLQLDTDSRLADAPATAPACDASPDTLAYVIYTSGSTGVPKGVMVEHGNVANFFAGMDDRIAHDPPGVWLAVTSLNFDISVLELFWTLARGFKVVLMGDADRLATSNAPVTMSERGMAFSLFYWGNDDGPGRQKYRLLLEGARFADSHGFCAVWTPERHFHAFGGPYPNPAVTGAAVAAVTSNIAVRAGSCVAPLHHPVRIAEDWAVIDNLTNGRTGLGLASGWHPVDFVLRPENRPPNNKQALFDTVDTLRRLWRGEEVAFDKGDGETVPIRTLPRPVSDELPLWITTAGNPDTWREAGALGANVLTHLLGQSIEEVAEKIEIYHAALREAGRDPDDHTVTLMLHSFVARDREHARAVARKPMQDYLRAAAGLVKQYAWAFPAFKRPQGARTPMEIDLSTLSEDEVAGILDYAFNRYFEDSGLFGTVEDCLARVEALKAIGVGEIACLIDYGIAPDTVLEGLYPLAEVVRRSNAGVAPAADDFSLAAQIIRHKVTHLQCTPSMARMLLGDDAARAALARVPHLMIGGEPLSGALAAELSGLTGAAVENMYGPTETTIWSSTGATRGGDGTQPLGRAIANTQLYVLDDAMQPAPEGVAGELWIGGDGVARGYWQRADLTADRFRPNPFGAGRIYRTGDLVRRDPDGALACLGRADHQIKLRGHRVEPGEIEAALEAQPGVTGAVVTAREDTPGDVRLVAYITGRAQDDPRGALAARLPGHMVPAHVITLDAFPLTPNRKIDRAALPAPGARAGSAAGSPQAAPAAAPDVPVRGIAADDTLARIAQVWSDVLGVDGIAPGDNFFDLGGHSLLAVQAHRTMRAALGLTGLSITDIFRFPVLRDLAGHVDSKLRPHPAAQQAEVAQEGLAPPESRETPTVPAAPAAPDARDAAMARRRAMRARRMART